MMSGGFEDFESLKKRAEPLIQVAETIKAKLARKELDADSAEMREIQAVMFNMGLANDFSTTVNKDTSGKNYHTELASEVERFLKSVMDKVGGVIGLIDLYCMYNRARGTDLISPEDLKIACVKLNNQSQLYMMKEYPSGIKTMQSRQFNSSSYYKRIADTLVEHPGLTPMRIAEQMQVNEVLIKEHIS